MNTELFLTVKTKAELDKVHHVMIKAFKTWGILSNIYKLESTVLDKQTDKINTEYGFKVEVLNDDIDQHTLIMLWLTLKEYTSIHCIWVNHNDFSGCITKIPVYLSNWEYYTDKLIKCSEYD